MSRLPALALLSLRMEATGNEYARHLIDCQLDFCPESFELARHADDAARVFGFERERQARRARSRTAAV